MTWWLRLSRWMEARIVDRHDVSSCLAFVMGIWPILAVLWGLQCVPWFSEEARRHYHPVGLSVVQSGLGALMLWLLVVGSVTWQVRHDHRAMPWLVQLTLVPAIWGLVLLGLGHGLQDNPMAMLILDVFVMSRALFVLKALRWAWGGALVLVIGNEVLQALGALPYAPLLTAPIFRGEALAPWWAVWLRLTFTVATLPLSGVLFFLAMALQRRRAELEALVRTDVLTGLANRREFMSQLEREGLRHARSGRPLSVVLFDVDHFKRINDTWGHPVGDAVLARIGAVLRSHTRERVDTAARYGGEEFVLLLPDTDLGGAQLVAEKIAARLRAEAFGAHGQPFFVTQSVGIAEVVEGDFGWALRVADRNLYQAKEAGRNRIVGSVAFAEDVGMRVHS